MVTGTSSHRCAASAATKLQRSCGFTLWELIHVVAIAGIALGLGVPALQNVVLDVRRLSALQSLVTAIRFARNEAQKSGRDLVLCPSVDASACTQTRDFGSGWIVFEPMGGASARQRPGAARVLHAGRPSREITLPANRPSFEFRPFPRRSTNGTFTYCDPRGDAEHRAVIVSYTGRPRIARGARAGCR